MLVSGHDVGEIARADQRFSHVIPAVYRDRTEQGLHRIDRFDPRVEAHVLADLENQPCGLIGVGRCNRGNDDPGRGITEADIPGLGLRHSVVGVGRHLKRMLVLESGAGARPNRLADDRTGALALLEPVTAVNADLSYRGPDGQRDRPDRIAVRNRQLAQKGRQLGMREGREPRAQPLGCAGRPRAP
jgi:hypothetical protein